MHCSTRTKVVCTIGPAVDSYEKIVELMQTGMNVARLNFSHGTHENHAATVENLKKAREALDKPLAIMLDTKGPEIRLGKIEGGELRVEAGGTILLTPTSEQVPGVCSISIHPGFVIEELKQGDKVLFDDGYVSSKVLKVSKQGALVEFDHGGVIRSGKGVNVPGANLHLPSLTDRDVKDIQFACLHDLDYIAASFVRRAEDITAIRKILEEEGKSNILIIAKIENSQGIDNFDSIVQAADGVMIARGDLGVEVPLSHVPRLQKMMIRKCRLAGKPSITATQMLESMIVNPRPTRAEVSDVANAIYDGTSMAMLSGETAVGQFPIKALSMMTTVIAESERDIDYAARFAEMLQMKFHDTPSAVSLSTVNTAYSTQAKAIFCISCSGRTARLISRLHPEMPILVLTPSKKVYHQLAAIWGVTPILGAENQNFEEAYEYLSEVARKRGIVHYGDLVTVSLGSPFGVVGTTNMMMVKSIGDVLVRGFKGYGERVHGRVTIVFSPDTVDSFAVKDKILVITKCDDTYLPLIKRAAGIVLENHIDDLESEKYALVLAKALETPTLVRADLASNILKEDQLVTLNPKQALIYNGIIK